MSPRQRFQTIRMNDSTAAPGQPAAATGPLAANVDRGHVSLEGLHSTVIGAARAGGLLGAVAGLRRSRDPGERRLHGSRQLGHRPARRGAVQVRPALGVGLASLMAIFMQVIAARLGVVTGKDLAQCCRDWYPRVDALAQLADERSGDRRLRPGRSAGQRRRSQPALPHSAALGRHHHRAGRAPACWRLQSFGMRTIEAVVLLLVATIAVCYFIEIFVLPQTKPSFLEMGARTDHAALSAGRNALRRHRHHWSDGDAAQPVPAFGAGAEPQAAEGRAHPCGVPITFNTIDSTVALTIAFFVNAAILVLAATRFLRQGKRYRPGRTGRPPSAPTATGSALPTSRWRRCWERRLPARCSRSRCWPADRAAPSPEPSPDRS